MRSYLYSIKAAFSKLTPFTSVSTLLGFIIIKLPEDELWERNRIRLAEVTHNFNTSPSPTRLPAFPFALILAALTMCLKLSELFSKLPTIFGHSYMCPWFLLLCFTMRWGKLIARLFRLSK